MKIIVIGIIIIMFLMDIGISILNYRNRNAPFPDNVGDIYEEPEYQRWLKYFMENFRFGIILKCLNLLIILIMLLLGGFAKLESISAGWFENDILQTLSFIGLYFMIYMILSLPFDYYKTFVIEEKYGFNKMTLRTFVLDQVKGLMIGAVIGGGILAVINAIFLMFSERMFLFVLLSWVVVTFVMILMILMNTRFFVKLFNKLSPVEEGSLKERIQDLACETGFEIQSIFVMDASRRSTRLNAFFSGMGRVRDVVLFDTLIEKLSEDEVLAVLAHELGHAIHKDVQKMFLRQIGFFGLFMAVLGLVLESETLPIAFGLSDVHFGFGLILFSVFVQPLSFILSIPINALSRKAEYAADAFSAEYIDRSHMVSALKMLSQENFSNLTPHPLYVMMHYSHPPVALRLEAINKL
ncbi:MAG: M48 family metallopeptidase [Clostridia bacterium]|nr:M48 family metallopeptidase [Clostridia bacterium]